jgi:hypothetical protein
VGSDVMAQIDTENQDETTLDPSLDCPLLDQAALFGLAGKFVELACKNSEANQAAVLITFLVRFGVEVGTGPKMSVGDTTHYARLFAVVVGATSKARKGTSAKPINKLFDGLDRFARTTPGPLSSGEGLIYAVRDSSQSSAENGDQGIDDKRLYVIDEEFGGALACNKRQGNTLSTVLRSAWDDGNLDPLTKHGKISVKEAHIGIVTHITITELNEKFNSTEFFSGFANRFLWIFSKRTKLVAFPKPMAGKELGELQGELERLVRKAQQDQEISFDEDVKLFWERIYLELSDDHPGLVGAIINRGEAQVLRISMIYCLLDGKDKISVVHLQAAHAVWNYCVASAYHIFGGREVDDVSQKILDGLKKGNLDGTGVNKLFNNHLAKSVLSKKLEDLVRSGKVMEEKDTSTGGRARVIYRLCG